MKARLLAAMLVAIPLFAMADEPAQPTTSLDVSGVTAIRIVGEASSIDLTTIEGEPLIATLGGQRIGWFAHWYSNWFYNDCRTSSRMAIAGTLLTVEAGPSSWLEPSDCRVELKANMKGGVSVAVEQAASQARLTGEFSTISLVAKAADFTLGGHAASVRLRSDALRSHLTFARTEGNETIAIAAHSLNTSLAFPPGTRISYEASAATAMVDSSLPNTVGAKPSIVIEGQYVRAAIR
ncbi:MULTISPECIES: hypothetical protein [unclassified Aureimonas]|uniref:hypothetical protein n=1 Tax=unclassified Aureimonas TaxID=2615206 RepID=UPI0006FC9374|nr:MULTISPECIES: hypothetical protein [unclassified Aureimonas]KQT64362.1 hypothetical protein ASG62_05135 [Aureimonas sp. Leaf427]KQT81551.1 hypothetical protein ASG54_02400 [Aureimonas sp. Leaf460]